MAFHLVTSGAHRRPAVTLVGSSPEVNPTPGPAVLFEGEGDLVGSFEGRPVAACEEGGDWGRVPDPVADQWVRLFPEVRARLVADPEASLSANEFDAVTRVGASVVAVYWVNSEDSAGFHVSGDLRRFVSVVADVSRSTV